MTNIDNDLDAYIDSCLRALDSLIDIHIFVPASDPDNDAISSADLIEQLLAPFDAHDLLHAAIHDIAFDCLDFDDEMLQLRIQSRIDRL